MCLQTLVLYFGDKPWNVSRSLEDTFKKKNNISNKLNNYKIDVFEIAYLTEEQIEMFQSDFGIIADYFVKRRKGYKTIENHKPIKHVDEMLKFMRIFAEDERFLQLDVKKDEKGEVTMCTILDNAINTGIERRIQQGIIQGENLKLIMQVQKKMKKNVKKIFTLMLVLCTSMSGCGTKKTAVKKEAISKKTTAEKKKTETRKLKKSNWIIEVDPGHGGNDSGAVGKTNDQLQEKDINLKIAKYIKQELSKNSNIKVYLTRTGDTKPELGERVPKAVQDKADLFISLHNNANGEIVDYDHGCTVLVPTGNYKKEVSKQAQLLGCYFLKHLEQTGVENQGLLMRTSEQNEKYPNGKIRDYYRVIHESIEQKIPGVIVEHAFVDNDKDVQQFLKDDNKIKKLAKADAQAIRDYCLGTVKMENDVEQRVTLIKDAKGKENAYFKKTFKLYEILKN